jgi:hypothetical protein
MEALRALRPASVTGVHDLDEYGKAPRLPTTLSRVVPPAGQAPLAGCSPTLTRRSLDHRTLADYASRAPAPQAQMLFTKEARGVEVGLKRDLVPRVKKHVFNSPFQVCCMRGTQLIVGLV